MKNFWHYAIVKQVRKLLWRSYALWKKTSIQPGASPRIGPTAYGVKMIERWEDRTYIYCRGATYGTFLSDFLEQRDEPFTFVDIGANQGLYSLIAARNTVCLKAIAFEPVQATHDVLVSNAAANDLSHRIEVHRLAISTHSGTIPIRIPHGHSGMAAIGNSGDLKGAVTLENINAISAVELEKILAGDGPMVAKVDVEGHEAEVFSELMKTRAASRLKSVFYEIDQRWSDEKRIETILRRAGFDRFTRVGFGHHFDVLAERA